MIANKHTLKTCTPKCVQNTATLNLNNFCYFFLCFQFQLNYYKAGNVERIVQRMR